MKNIFKKITLMGFVFSSFILTDLITSALPISANVAVAAPVTGKYAQVGRSNDPFVFCTQGVPQHNWAPVNPLAGTWRCTRRCKYVNYRWIPVYQSICPAAMSRGAWTGPGSGDMYKAAPPDKLVPFKH